MACCDWCGQGIAEVASCEWPGSGWGSGSSCGLARLSSVDLGRWMEIQWTEIKGERLTGVFAGDRGSRWPEKRTHAAEGPGARGRHGETQRDPVDGAAVVLSAAAPASSG